MVNLDGIRVIVPLAVPFTEDFDLNLAMVGPMVEAAIAEGADALAVGGTLSEFYALEREERLALIEACIKACGGKVPVIAGTGAMGTREAIELTQAAENLGADLAMVVTPFYCLPSQDDLVRHYAMVAKSTKLPILLYNIPHWSGVNIEPRTLEKLAKITNIVGIKDEIGSVALQNTEYHSRVKGKFSFYCGSDHAFLPYLIQGGAGGYTSILTVNRTKKMLELFDRGDNSGAMDIYYQIYEFLKVYTINGRLNPLPLCKRAHELYGLAVGGPRPPMATATESETEEVRAAMRRFGAI